MENSLNFVGACFAIVHTFCDLGFVVEQTTDSFLDGVVPDQHNVRRLSAKMNDVWVHFENLVEGVEPESFGRSDFLSDELTCKAVRGVSSSVVNYLNNGSVGAYSIETLNDPNAICAYCLDAVNGMKIRMTFV